MKFSHKIKEEDFVIVGWSDITRYRRIDFNKEKPIWKIQYINEDESLCKNNLLIEIINLLWMN